MGHFPYHQEVLHKSFGKYSAIKENITELPILLINGGCPGGRNTREIGKRRRKSFIFFHKFQANFRQNFKTGKM